VWEFILEVRRHLRSTHGTWFTAISDKTGGAYHSFRPLLVPNSAFFFLFRCYIDPMCSSRLTSILQSNHLRSSMQLSPPRHYPIC
jgi:hypothetical protein